MIIDAINGLNTKSVGRVKKPDIEYLFAID